FAPGRTGRLFTEFALALAGAVLVSGVVALTLSPMMSSVLLRHNPRPNWFDRGMERALTSFTRGYCAALAWSLRHRWLVVLVMVGSAAVTWSVMGSIKRELAPMEDRGVVLAQINAPDGATLEYTNRYARSIERVGESFPEFDRVFANIGSPTVAQGTVFFRAVPWEERQRTTIQMAREMTPRVAGTPGVTAFPSTPPSLGQGFTQRPVNFVIITSESYQNLSQSVRAFQDELAKKPGFLQVYTDVRLNKPEFRL
ncbi:MAG: efflux RND transporter permease subunit, partial [Rhodoferax sp.]